MTPQKQIDKGREDHYNRSVIQEKTILICYYMGRKGF